MRRAIRAVIGVGLTALVVANAGGLVLARRRAQGIRVVHPAEARVHPVDGPSDGPALRLITIGDSVMAGDGIADADLTLPMALARALANHVHRPVALTQLGVSGHTTTAVLTEQVPRLATLRPDVVAVSVGVNDGLARRPLRRIAEDHRRLAAAIAAAAPGAVRVLVGAPDLGAAPALPRPANRAVGWLTGRVGSRQGGWLADSGMVVVPVGRPTTHFAVDGFHPGPTGTPLIAGWVLAAIADQLPAG